MEMNPIAGGEVTTATGSDLENLTQEDVMTMSMKELLSIGEKFVEEMEYEKAREIFEIALKRFGEEEEILTSYGYFAFNAKEIVKAKELLLRSAELNPEMNPKKYFHLGQLHSGKEALVFYSHGVAILEKACATVEPHQVDSETQKDVQADLAHAYSAIAELYLTDLAGESGAEEICQAALEKSLQIDAECLDAFYQMSQYYLNKQMSDEAKPWLKRIVNKYKELEEKSEEADEYTEDFMLQVVRALIEVEEYADAEFFCNLLLSEDDKDNEYLYLMIFCLFKQEQYGPIKEYLPMINRKTLDEDPELAIGLKELEEQLEPKMAAYEAQAAQEPPQEHQMGEDEWEDDEEEKGEHPQ